MAKKKRRGKRQNISRNLTTQDWHFTITRTLAFKDWQAFDTASSGFVISNVSEQFLGFTLAQTSQFAALAAVYDQFCVRNVNLRFLTLLLSEILVLSLTNCNWLLPMTPMEEPRLLLIFMHDELCRFTPRTVLCILKLTLVLSFRAIFRIMMSYKKDIGMILLLLHRNPSM